MNPAQEPESRPPAETARILLLFSRQLDGDLTQEESAELAGLQQTDAQQGFFASMTDLRGQMKALPVKPVAASFATSVLDAIHQESITAPATSTPNARRGRIMRWIVAVSVTACAAALMLWQRSQELDFSVDLSARATQIAQPEKMRPFIENDQWRIVVVTVNSKDPKEVLRIVESLAAKNGMDIQSVVSNDNHDARFAVLFTSTGDSDNAFFDSVIAETDPQSADWNPQLVADSTGESCIRRIQESMKTPTLSELHFGKVYVALPNSSKAFAADSQTLVAQNDAVEGASFRSAATEKAAPPNDVATTGILPSAQETPVLVVFEFHNTAPEHI